MPFNPSVQSFVGAHSSGTYCTIDWDRQRVFEINGTYLSRYGLISGLEESFAPLADMGGTGQNGSEWPMAVGQTGDLFISATGTLYNGGIMYVDGQTLGMLHNIPYPPPKFGKSKTAITYGSTQYCLDLGTLNDVDESSTTAFLASQGFANSWEGFGCAGPEGSGTGYIIDSPSAGFGPSTLSKVQFNGAGFVSNTVIGNITMAQIDPTWTFNFRPGGICLDQTDGKLLLTYSAQGGTLNTRLVKIDPTDASIVWNTTLPLNLGAGLVPGNMMQFSSIKHQRIGFFCLTEAAIYNTADGSLVDQYITGLNGFSNLDGQCYNDTLGCVVLGCDFTQVSGSPTLLNSTPTSWGDGFAALYLAAPISTRKRRFLAESRPTRIIQ